MLILIRKDTPDVVWSTHSNRMRDDLFDLDRTVFEIWRTSEPVRPFGPLPTEYVVVDWPDEAEASA